MQTERMTMAQALVKFLNQQYISVDGVETPFVEGSPPSLVTVMCLALAVRLSRIPVICR